MLSICNVKVYELPPLITKPLPNVNVFVVVAVVEAALREVMMLTPPWSRSFNVPIVVVAALPLKVIVELFNTTGPALFAVKVIVPMLSWLDLV